MLPSTASTSGYPSGGASTSGLKMKMRRLFLRVMSDARSNCTDPWSGAGPPAGSAFNSVLLMAIFDRTRMLTKSTCAIVLTKST